MSFRFKVTRVSELEPKTVLLGGYFEYGSVCYSGAIARVEGRDPDERVVIKGRALINRKAPTDQRTQVLSIEPPSYDLAELEGAILLPGG